MATRRIVAPPPPPEPGADRYDGTATLLASAAGDLGTPPARRRADVGVSYAPSWEVGRSASWTYSGIFRASGSRGSAVSSRGLKPKSS